MQIAVAKSPLAVDDRDAVGVNLRRSRQERRRCESRKISGIRAKAGPENLASAWRFPRMGAYGQPLTGRAFRGWGPMASRLPAARPAERGSAILLLRTGFPGCAFPGLAMFSLPGARQAIEGTKRPSVAPFHAFRSQPRGQADQLDRTFTDAHTWCQRGIAGLVARRSSKECEDCSILMGGSP